MQSVHGVEQSMHIIVLCSSGLSRAQAGIMLDTPGEVPMNLLLQVMTHASVTVQ